MLAVSLARRNDRSGCGEIENAHSWSLSLQHVLVSMSTSIHPWAHWLTAWGPSRFCFTFLMVILRVSDHGRQLLRKHRCPVDIGR